MPGQHSLWMHAAGLAVAMELNAQAAAGQGRRLVRGGPAFCRDFGTTS